MPELDRRQAKAGFVQNFTPLVPISTAATLGATYPFRGAVRAEPDGRMPVVQMRDASSDCPLADSVPRLINDNGKYDRYRLLPGDILLQARGSRHPAVIVLQDEPAIAAPGLHVLRAKPDCVSASYLVWCLNHPRIQSQIAAAAQGTHAPFISKQSLGDLRIPVPTKAVQHLIAETSLKRQRARQIAAELEEARDALIDAATWEAATDERPGSA
jgi:hypothetical protein